MGGALCLSTSMGHTRVHGEGEETREKTAGEEAHHGDNPAARTQI